MNTLLEIFTSVIELRLMFLAHDIEILPQFSKRIKELGCQSGGSVLPLSFLLLSSSERLLKLRIAAVIERLVHWLLLNSQTLMRKLWELILHLPLF